jgi:anthranilate synthase component 1
MKKIAINTTQTKMLADIISPVSLYLRLRDVFPSALLLESSDYHGSDNSTSYLCLDPVASFTVDKGHVELIFPNGEREKTAISEEYDVVDSLNEFTSRFEFQTKDSGIPSQGMFGYMGYNSVSYFEDINLKNNGQEEDGIPDIKYNFYRYLIAIDHYKNELFLIEHHLEGQELPSKLGKIINIIKSFDVPSFPFSSKNDEQTNYSDEEFLEIIQKGKDLCQKGEVFQIVLSRKFQTSFTGDEFNVYRALRSINPSPYLFFFDYGSFKIFGSSPEAQIVIKNNKASIHPIAGTFKRTGSDMDDELKAKELAEDPKENSEHVMLVDLARNDLSKHGSNVEVETFKEVQFYSHVIHLVSKVTADLGKETTPLKMVAETFPAGTLSGAPKYRAMELIDELENSKRGYYGGAIGYLGFNGDFNHAIMIRSFLSRKNKLIYQAGAGVVAKSNINNELMEVNNKLAALRKAIKMGEGI